MSLIIVDFETGYARRLLQGHPSMQPESIDMVIGSNLVTMGGEPAHLGINPITISPYFCRHNSDLFDSFAIGLGKGTKAICKATKTRLQK